jgi:biopolymer transport protein TolR
VGRRRKREYNLDLVSDINVTSLVDVMMTLLIIFIIVAPMMEQGIDITLPTAEPKRIDVAEVLTISVAENERVYLEGQRVTLEELGERDLKYGKVVEVLDTVRGVGITRLAMATKPTR